MRANPVARHSSYCTYVEMGKELNIGEEFNLGCTWARVHGGLEVGRKCLGRKMMRVDARVSRVDGYVRSTRLP
jgi:hypothetical protein